MPDTETPPTTDLHSRVREALEERIRLAREATSGPWSVDGTSGAITHDNPHTVIPGSRWGTYVVPSVGAYDGRKPSGPDAAFIAANSPDVEIRRAEAGLRVLDRHAPEYDPSEGGYVCPAHNVREWGEHVPTRYPCDEVRDLADGEGIEP